MGKPPFPGFCGLLKQYFLSGQGAWPQEADTNEYAFDHPTDQRTALDVTGERVVCIVTKGRVDVDWWASRGWVVL